MVATILNGHNESILMNLVSLQLVRCTGKGIR